MLCIWGKRSGRLCQFRYGEYSLVGSTFCVWCISKQITGGKLFLSYVSLLLVTSNMQIIQLTILLNVFQVESVCSKIANLNVHSYFTLFGPHG